MTESDENTSIAMEDLVVVGHFDTLAHANEHSLVILAMGEACWIQANHDDDSFTLYAEPLAAPRIANELLDYTSEQVTPATSSAPTRVAFRHPAGWDVIGIWTFCVLMVFFWQIKDPTLVGHAASSSIGLIRNGEWWRPFTALFLHADTQHMVGNLLSGTLFGSLVSRLVGPWRGWALILGCGTIGNAMTSIVTWPEPFVSLGASTAVFAALGILSGLGVAVMWHAGLRLPLAKTTAPLIAGVVLLGLMGGGTPGGNTDVLGHVFGFTAGLISGLLAGRFMKSASNDWLANAPRSNQNTHVG